MSHVRIPGDKARHYGTIEERAQAATRAAVTAKQRPCLGGCGRTVTSAHAGRRLCRACVERNRRAGG